MTKSVRQTIPEVGIVNRRCGSALHVHVHALTTFTVCFLPLHTTAHVERLPKSWQRQRKKALKEAAWVALKLYKTGMTLDYVHSCVQPL